MTRSFPLFGPRRASVGCRPRQTQSTFKTSMILTQHLLKAPILYFPALSLHEWPPQLECTASLPLKGRAPTLTHTKLASAIVSHLR